MKAFYWAMLAALTWGCVPLIEKMGLMKINPYAGLFFRCWGVILGMVFLFIWKSSEIKSSFSPLPTGFVYLILGGFLASVVGQIFFYNALKSGEASRVVPVSGAYPLISFLLAVFLLGEQVTVAKCIGVVFVLAGVFLLK